LTCGSHAEAWSPALAFGSLFRCQGAATRTGPGGHTDAARPPRRAGRAGGAGSVAVVRATGHWGEG